MSFDTALFIGIVSLAWAVRAMMRHPKATARSASFLWNILKGK